MTSKDNVEDYIVFEEKIFRRADLSEETIEWIEWYNSLTEEEKLSVNLIPSELNTRDEVGTMDGDAAN